LGRIHRLPGKDLKQSEEIMDTPWMIPKPRQRLRGYLAPLRKISESISTPVVRLPHDDHEEKAHGTREWPWSWWTRVETRNHHLETRNHLLDPKAAATWRNQPWTAGVLIFPALRMQPRNDQGRTRATNLR